MDLKNSLLLMGGCAAWIIALLLPVEYDAGASFLMEIGIGLTIPPIYNMITQYFKQKKKTHEITSR